MASQPVWTTRQAQANSLMNAVLRAGDHGLAPELFHADLLRSPATLPPLDQELLLSDAFLSYADALARGAMPVERRRDDETLTPEPIDVAAALDAAIGSPDPAAAIEALAPTTPTYRLLRQALQNFRAGTPAGDKATATRLREIEVNLERQRWLPRRLPAERVWVNVADARLVLYRDDRPVFSTRVIVGQDDRHNQSPEFQAINRRNLVQPSMERPVGHRHRGDPAEAQAGPELSGRHNMVMLPDGGLQQLPGPGSALGQINVRDERTGSTSTCTIPRRKICSAAITAASVMAASGWKIAHELAALLMQQPIDAINQTIATGSTTRSNLPTPVSVFVVYETAFADVDGTLQFRPDVYGRDAEIWPYLEPSGERWRNARRPTNAGVDLYRGLD